MVSRAEFDQLQAEYDRVNEEKDQSMINYQLTMKETSFKLTCAQAQISQLQEAKVEADKLQKIEKVG